MPDRNLELIINCLIETLLKVWEISKKLWKHSPTARVPTAFLVLPNFHSCFYLTIIPLTLVGYEMIDSQLGATRLVSYNHLISNKRGWNNFFY